MYLLSTTAKKICMGVLIIALGCATVGWSTSTTPRKNATNQLRDTIPNKNRNKVYQEEPKDIDQRIELLDKVMENLDKRLQSKDLEKLQQKLEESISKIDVESIQNKINESMKKMDLTKLQLDATTVMKKIDWEKIQQQIRDAMEEAKDKTTMKKLQQQLQESIKDAEKSMQSTKKIDFDKIKIELDKSREQLLKTRVNIEKELQVAKEAIVDNKGMLRDKLSKARDEIFKAKDELKSYQIMIGLMEKDGLLNSKEDYKIDYQSGSLMINGKKQPQEVVDRYQSYYKKRNLHIKKEKGNFSVNGDN